MSKILYLECTSGISGDMTAAALLDLGASETAVMRALDSLNLPEFTVRISRVEKSGLDVCDFDVVLDDAHENSDHDMAYLHGDAQTALNVVGGVAGKGTTGENLPDYGTEHVNRNEQRGIHTGKHHTHRNLSDIREIIEAADMTEHAKKTALTIFSILAQAEATVHGSTIEEVHFHEVGAADSIADIVAISVAFDNLACDGVVVGELCEGKGTIRCQHGLIPIPAPATSNIVSAYHIPLHILNVHGELVTPTGAAVVAALRTTDTLPEHFTIERIGMGAGKRAYETPGILRAMILEPAELTTPLNVGVPHVT